MTDMDTYEINALRRDAEIELAEWRNQDPNYGHFHIGCNMPGYMPEAETICVDDAVSAWLCFHGAITHALDAIEDDGDFLAIDTERATITESDVRSGDVSVMVDGYVYWVEHSAEDILLCTRDSDTEW